MGKAGPNFHDPSTRAPPHGEGRGREGRGRHGARGKETGHEGSEGVFRCRAKARERAGHKEGSLSGGKKPCPCMVMLTLCVRGSGDAAETDCRGMCGSGVRSRHPSLNAEKSSSILVTWQSPQ